MLGARPKGNLPQNAIHIVPAMAANAVDVNMAPAGMPSSLLNIAGFTARMYDIVRKMVIPARISVRIVVSFGLKPNSFVSLSIFFVDIKNT
jgi:hypothetical protein